MTNGVVAIPRETRPRRGVLSSATLDDDTNDDNKRWRLVLTRATVASFFYAVLSTRIFCLPSCPSRRPRRANVRYFTTAFEASAAGFRPCRRCKPDSVAATQQASPTTSSVAQKQTVEAACAYMHERAGNLQLVDLAGHVGLSPRYFHGLFKQIVGVTPGVYAAGIRRGRVVKQTLPAIASEEIQLVDDTGGRNADATLITNEVYDSSLFRRSITSPGLDVFISNFYKLAEPCEEQDMLVIDDNKTLEFNWNIDLEDVGYLASNIESIQHQTGLQLSGCVDPALLTTHTVPPQWLTSNETSENIDSI
ncbi:metal binding domain of Ada-domain-containing protein [Biscogniauxia marginata]|nr:metal binding domain of Ada-domain-containing protein [Biscogniauxia marginata]